MADDPTTDVVPVKVGSLWHRNPPGREVLQIKRVWDFQGGPTFRGHPTTGGKPVIGPLAYLREHYTERDYPPVSTVADRLRADLGEPVMDAARERDNTPVSPACPTCGPTRTEPHPRHPGVTRCANCKEWL